MQKEINTRFCKVEERVEKLEKVLKPSKEGKIVVCSYCGYSWVTISKKFRTSCPKCTQRPIINPKTSK